MAKPKLSANVARTHYWIEVENIPAWKVYQATYFEKGAPYSWYKVLRANKDEAIHSCLAAIPINNVVAVFDFSEGDKNVGC